MKFKLIVSLLLVCTSVAYSASNFDEFLGSNGETSFSSHNGQSRWLLRSDKRAIYMQPSSDAGDTSDYLPGLVINHNSVSCEDVEPYATSQQDFVNDCNGIPGMKLLFNVKSNYWTEPVATELATTPYNAHASSLFIQSFGRSPIYNNYYSTGIGPAGIHLEPHGQHYGIRISGEDNVGTNIRIDTAKGGTGIAIYGGHQAIHCEDIKGSGNEKCDAAPRLLDLRNGTLNLDNVSIVGSPNIEGTPSQTPILQSEREGRETFANWVQQGSGSNPSWRWGYGDLHMHCVYHKEVDRMTKIKVSPGEIINLHGKNEQIPSDIRKLNNFVVVDKWDPGSLDAHPCGGTQLITNSSGLTYGYIGPPEDASSYGGFAVAVLDANGNSVNPANWKGTFRPSFYYELYNQ